MSKTKRKTIEGSLYSPWQLLEAANAYYLLSDGLTTQRRKDVTEAVWMAEVAASATNRILAVELYLKALLVGSPVCFPAVHDLCTLFNALPSSTRHAIDREFMKRLRCDTNPDQTWSFHIYFQLGDHAIVTPDYLEPVDETLGALLERNKEGFSVSRYLFEKARADAPSLYEYEYVRLGVLSGALREILDASLCG